MSWQMMGDASSTTVSQSSDADADAGQAATKRSELEMPKMSSGELCAILKGGTGALARPWGDASSSSTDGGFSAFKAATFEECVSRGREAGQRQQAKLKKEVGDEVDAEDDLAAAEAEEAELLKGVEQVKSRLFEGKEWKRATKSDKEIGREWQEKAKRQTKATVVLLDGHVVDKKTAGNAKWEAVKTITGDAGALERLRVPKRSRRKIGHERRVPSLPSPCRGRLTSGGAATASPARTAGLCTSAPTCVGRASPRNVVAHCETPSVLGYSTPSVLATAPPSSTGWCPSPCAAPDLFPLPGR